MSWGLVIVAWYCTEVAVAEASGPEGAALATGGEELPTAPVNFFPIEDTVPQQRFIIGNTIAASKNVTLVSSSSSDALHMCGASCPQPNRSPSIGRSSIDSNHSCVY